MPVANFTENSGTSLLNMLDTYAVRLFAERIRNASEREDVWMAGSEPRYKPESHFEATMFETLVSIIGTRKAHRLVMKYGSFDQLSTRIPGAPMYPTLEQQDKELDELCDRINDAAQRTRRLAEIFNQGHKRKVPFVFDTETLIAHYRRCFKHLKREQLRVVLLDDTQRLIRSIPVVDGTVDHVMVPIKELVGPALQFRARAWAVGHNHPSGDPTPSKEDHALTERLVAISDLIKIPLVDHIIIADAEGKPNAHSSMRILGHIDI